MTDIPTELRIVRNFSAPVDAVFNTLTDPEAMVVWWGQNTTFDIDLRVGGKWKIIRTEQDKTYTALGAYLEVDRPQLLKYTYAMPQFSANTDTITFAIVPDGESCILTFIQAGPDIAAELSGLEPDAELSSEQGWKIIFDQIEDALSK